MNEYSHSRIIAHLDELRAFGTGGAIVFKTSNKTFRITRKLFSFESQRERAEFGNVYQIWALDVTWKTVTELKRSAAIKFIKSLSDLELLGYRSGA